MIKSSITSRQSIFKLLAFEDSIMYAQYDGLIGIMHLHSDDVDYSCFVNLKKPIYDMDIVHKEGDQVVVVAVGAGGVYILKATLDRQ